MQKIRLVISLIFFLMFAVLSCNAEANQSAPFQLRLFEKPKTVQAGQTYKFTVEIKNNSTAPLTLCLLPRFSWNWFWKNPNGTGGGEGVIHGADKLIIGTNYDPDTKEFHCKYLHYDRNDFITIPSQATHIIDLSVDVPKDCRARKASLTFDFEFQYDGREIGISAWTGRASPLRVSIPVRARTT